MRAPYRVARILILGDVRAELLGSLPPLLEHGDLSLDLLDPFGNLRVRALAQSFRRSPDGPTLVIAGARLSTPECTVLGFADRRRQIAAVSVVGLDEPEQPPAASRRLDNLIRHELGHLDGLAHCRSVGCLMHPAAGVRDLDRRSTEPCGRCPRSHSWTWLLQVGGDLGGLMKAPWAAFRSRSRSHWRPRD